LLESLRKQYVAQKSLRLINWRLVSSYALRTSLVTGLVPIYFVGMSVSLYNYFNHKIDRPDQRFYFTLASAMSLFPWYYILPVVERLSPFWIGGHILGFMSFFTWLSLSGNDMFKMDSQLVFLDLINREKQVKGEKSAGHRIKGN